jgi:uncharacterized protein (TIGR02246 family)
VLRTITVCLALLMPGWMLGQAVPQAQQTDAQAIHGVLDSFMNAWNQHDAKAFAAVFAEDADFTNVRGVSASGRAKIEEFHAPLFATIFKNSHQTFPDIAVRFIRNDIAAVDVHWEMTGATDAQGNAGPLRRGLLNFLMVRKAETWEIEVMHNMDLTSVTPPAK